MPGEWTAEFDKKVEVPEEHRKRMRFKFLVVFPQPRGAITGWCAKFEFQPVGNVLVLHDVLSDTSERQQGITLKKRITHSNEMTFWGAAAMLLPHKEEEAGDGGQ